jgi:hypothetical protein
MDSLKVKDLGKAIGELDVNSILDTLGNIGFIMGVLLLVFMLIGIVVTRRSK